MAKQAVPIIQISKRLATEWVEVSASYFKYAGRDSCGNWRGCGQFESSTRTMGFRRRCDLIVRISGA